MKPKLIGAKNLHNLAAGLSLKKQVNEIKHQRSGRRQLHESERPWRLRNVKKRPRLVKKKPKRREEEKAAHTAQEQEQQAKKDLEQVNFYLSSQRFGQQKNSFNLLKLEFNTNTTRTQYSDFEGWFYKSLINQT